MRRIWLLPVLLLGMTPAWAGDDCRAPQCRAPVENTAVRKRPIDYDRVNRILDAEIARQSRRTRCIGIDFGGGISTLTCD